MLAAMFSGRHQCTKDKDGRFFIDLDGDIFSHILNYLRFDEIPSADIALLVYKHARGLGLQSLISHLGSFSSVRLEKSREAYPWYRDMIGYYLGGSNSFLLSQVRRPASIQFISTVGRQEQMCDNCRTNVWRAVANDECGLALQHSNIEDI